MQIIITIRCHDIPMSIPNAKFYMCMYHLLTRGTRNHRKYRFKCKVVLPFLIYISIPYGHPGGSVLKPVPSVQAGAPGSWNPALHLAPC